MKLTHHLLVLLSLGALPAASATQPGTSEASSDVAGAAEARGNAEAGRRIFLDRDLGHCLLCHPVAQLSAPFHGNIGPDLSDVGARLNAETIRARLVDPTRFNPETVMPAYHRSTDLNQVAEQYRGKPILDGQQLEDLLAFLLTLRGPEAAGTTP